MDIAYRNLLPTESQAYRKIRLDSLQKFPNSFCAKYQEALATKKFRLETDIENQTFERFVYGAFSNNELIGICAVVKNEMNNVTLNQMYIQESFQGRNIGLKLVEEVIKEVIIRYGSIEINLEVANNNFKAYNLYKKIGFEEVNVKENPNSVLMKYSANIKR